MHGVEIYLTETLEEKVRDNYHTVLIARNWDGVKELNRLVSISCDRDHFYYTNRISFDEFLAASENIISTSACLASPLNKLPHDHPYYMKLARKYDFLEVQPHNYPDQIAYNKWLMELSKELGKPLIAGTDTHSSSPYKAECRTVLLSAKHKNYGDENFFDLTYKTYDELVEMFRRQGALPEEVFMDAIANTNCLADMVEDFELDKSIKYPILYGSREADSEKFTETVERMFAEKCANGTIPPEQQKAFRSAIDEEMRVFRKLKMDGFMLSMSELICWCKRQGMAIGPARGSVGGSRVAYVTDIIDLNPETWHTVFSRFCNEDRTEIGDIDIDCVESDRPAIFRHIIDRFGADNTARVAAFGTIKARSAIDDVGRHLSLRWQQEHENAAPENNPWSLKNMSRIKREYDSDPEGTAENYKELFYYVDGLIDTKVSQSVHPAGMIISPISLTDNYGMFDKDGENCLMLDMEEAHEVGVAKYDFLVLKTVQVIRDTCRYLGVDYPRTNEIDWDDQEVWADMRRDLTAIFQFEGDFAANSFKRFKTNSIFDMSIVTACIRPSGASYRDQLLDRVPHKNPSEMIDELLKDNLGYLIYQEDTIRFLQQICGLTGSEADNVRRAIGRKQKDRLDAALPAILEGYCNKSPKPREEAEKEAKEFLQIIEDSASYQFGMNHSIAYCLLGYLCGYFRYYHPVEFLTSFLNNAANDDDIKNGTAYAHKVGIKITMPKWGVSKSEYFYDAERRIIAKGLSSVKYMSPQVAEELYALSARKRYKYFTDLLSDLNSETSINSRQLDTLIKIDFFSDFGNQRELREIVDLFVNRFNSGRAKQIKKSMVDGRRIAPIIEKYSTGLTKSGGVAKSYTIVDMPSILHEVEELVLSSGLEDLSDTIKIQNFYDVMGYIGYTSDKPEDRLKIYIMEERPIVRRKDGMCFAHSVHGRSIGSGKEADCTIFNDAYRKNPVTNGDIIRIRRMDKNDRGYWVIHQYERVLA